MPNNGNATERTRFWKGGLSGVYGYARSFFRRRSAFSIRK